MMIMAVHSKKIKKYPFFKDPIIFFKSDQFSAARRPLPYTTIRQSKLHQRYKKPHCIRRIPMTHTSVLQSKMLRKGDRLLPERAR